MGTQGPMTDPHMGWREVREEVPCSEGQDGEEKRRGERNRPGNRGSEASCSLLPSCLACSGLHSP